MSLEDSLTLEQRQRLEATIQTNEVCYYCQYCFPLFDTVACSLLHNLNSRAYTKALIELGADVNKRSGLEGRTPLMIIIGVSNNKVNEASMLLEYGADVNAVTIEGHTALDCVVGKEIDDLFDLVRLQNEDSFDLVRLLAKHGARYGTQISFDRYRNTILNALYCSMTSLVVLCGLQRHHPFWLPADCLRLLFVCLIDSREPWKHNPNEILAYEPTDVSGVTPMGISRMLNL
jgi:hypothetical protein